MSLIISFAIDHYQIERKVSILIVCVMIEKTKYTYQKQENSTTYFYSWLTYNNKNSIQIHEKKLFVSAMYNRIFIYLVYIKCTMLYIWTDINVFLAPPKCTVLNIIVQVKRTVKKYKPLSVLNTIFRQLRQFKNNVYKQICLHPCDNMK